ncbi:MAG TPA: DUF3253 domain-containing protein [Edaphobacter sp.]|nr:DUF3253 domain-containing protein [Edaphobacter sp.]
MPDRKPKPERETPRKERLCKTCRRPFTWNEARAQDWDIAKYCSPQCSGHIDANKAEELETAILELLAERGVEKSICPSEAAKRVGGTSSRHGWESLMEPAREVARRLAKEGRIIVTQKGKPVDPFKAKGPIRLRLP